MKALKSKLPDYPRTMHLPHKPNTVRGDLIASSEEAALIFTSPRIVVEEKVDGANCAMMLMDGQAIVRNRNHILRKGYSKGTPAKMQFSSIWGWFYDNKEKFIKLNELMGYEAGVYGEWMYAIHGIAYDKLPNYFITYDVFDPDKGEWVDSLIARNALSEAGFNVVNLISQEPVASYEQLESWCESPSFYSTGERIEGLYIKVSDGHYINGRFKMVRNDFVQGALWNEKKLTRQKLQSKSC
jgi:atypical dual specificity phosphatase